MLLNRDRVYNIAITPHQRSGDPIPTSDCDALVPCNSSPAMSADDFKLISGETEIRGSSSEALVPPDVSKHHNIQAQQKFPSLSSQNSPTSLGLNEDNLKSDTVIQSLVNECAEAKFAFFGSLNQLGQALSPSYS